MFKVPNQLTKIGSALVLISFVLFLVFVAGCTTQSENLIVCDIVAINNHPIVSYNEIGDYIITQDTSLQGSSFVGIRLLIKQKLSIVRAFQLPNILLYDAANTNKDSSEWGKIKLMARFLKKEMKPESKYYCTIFYEGRALDNFEVTQSEFDYAVGNTGSL